MKLVDPFGSVLTASLKALQLVNDAIKNGITKTRNGEIRAGPVLEISETLSGKSRNWADFGEHAVRTR